MSFWFKIQAWSLITFASHFSWNSCFLFHKAGYIPKSTTFSFQRAFNFFFFFLKARAASLAQPFWLPSNPSFIPSSRQPKPPCCCRSPRQCSSLQDGAGHEIPRGRVSKLYICSFHLKNVSGSVPSSLAMLFHSSFLPALSSPASPQTVLVYGFPHRQLNSLNLITVISTSCHAPPPEICGDTEEAKKAIVNSR